MNRQQYREGLTRTSGVHQATTKYQQFACKSYKEGSRILGEFVFNKLSFLDYVANRFKESVELANNNGVTGRQFFIRGVVGEASPGRRIHKDDVANL